MSVCVNVVHHLYSWVGSVQEKADGSIRGFLSYPNILHIFLFVYYFESNLVNAKFFTCARKCFQFYMNVSSNIKHYFQTLLWFSACKYSILRVPLEEVHVIYMRYHKKGKGGTSRLKVLSDSHKTFLNLKVPKSNLSTSVITYASKVVISHFINYGVKTILDCVLPKVLQADLRTVDEHLVNPFGISASKYKTS